MLIYWLCIFTYYFSLLTMIPYCLGRHAALPRHRRRRPRLLIMFLYLLCFFTYYATLLTMILYWLGLCTVLLMLLYWLRRHAALLRPRRRRAWRDAHSRGYLLCYFTYYDSLLTMLLYLLCFFTYYASLLTMPLYFLGRHAALFRPRHRGAWRDAPNTRVHLLCYFTYHVSLLTTY